jgi:hypothetical protein
MDSTLEQDPRRQQATTTTEQPSEEAGVDDEKLHGFLSSFMADGGKLTESKALGEMIAAIQ